MIRYPKGMRKFVTFSPDPLAVCKEREDEEGEGMGRGKEKEGEDKGGEGCPQLGSLDPPVRGDNK